MTSVTGEASLWTILVRSSDFALLVESGDLGRDSGSRDGDLEVLLERFDILRCALWSFLLGDVIDRSTWRGLVHQQQQGLSE